MGPPAATQRSGRRGEKEAQRMIRSLGRRCRGDLWSPAQWRPGLPAGACAAGRPHFFPKKWGERRAGGAPPTLDPPERGPTAAESRTDKAGTGRASTPGSFFSVRFRRCRAPGRPAATQRSGRRGERRHSERLRRHTARRAGACPRRPFRIRRRAGCAGNDKGRTPAPDVRPSSKERGYNEMKETVSCEYDHTKDMLTKKNSICYRSIKFQSFFVKFLSCGKIRWKMWKNRPNAEVRPGIAPAAGRSELEDRMKRSAVSCKCYGNRGLLTNLAPDVTIS